MSNSAETQHALYMFTRSFKPYKNENFLDMKIFSDGLPFAHILSSIEYFSGFAEQLEEHPDKWTQKLANLKKITNKMQTYIETEAQKVLKMSDIELVQIAKNISQEQIIKLFEAVIAVLMQTPKKQDYIQRIMSLDERSQQALVIIVQNAMDERISELSTQSKLIEPSQLMTQLKYQNSILTQYINELSKQNESLLKQNNEFQQKIQEYQLQIEKYKNLSMEICKNSLNKSSQVERENSIIQVLKKKMIEMARQHQIQLTKLNDQIDHYKNIISHSKETQQEFFQKSKLQEQKLRNVIFVVEDERKRFQKTIDQKQIKIKKLEYELQISNHKIRELSEDIEINDLNLRMELQKKEVRFKQLQKQIKKGLSQRSLELSSKKKIQQESMIKNDDLNEEEIEFLKSEVQKLRNLNRQLERQILKLKKRCEKVEIIEEEKKKLERIILEVSKCKDSEIQMLVISLQDLRNQNIKMHEVIKNLKWRQQSKFD